MIDDAGNYRQSHEPKGGPEQKGANVADSFLADAVQPVEACPADQLTSPLREHFAQNDRGNQEPAEGKMQADQVCKQAIITKPTERGFEPVHGALLGVKYVGNCGFRLPRLPVPRDYRVMGSKKPVNRKTNS